MANRSRVESTLPEDARNALERMGSSIRAARRERNLTITHLAERSMLSRPTLIRIEHGDPTTSIGAVATVLSMLGLIEEFEIGNRARMDIPAGGENELDDF